ncbi:hypothetical protein E2562_023146 [Oryza meyeriana var. granulata]|uniref:3'-5' exonuclease domain-containing protein n=1 Tax=Oryza meyeriana var. granulata TaxID=110450 RepID=A0A6G1E143_9ORYZ|nr:hypothetical protein E2562_023146 [Oryza meyeriana var. granulata]
MKGPVEVTFLKTSDGDDSDDDNRWYWCPRREAVLCFGADLAFVDVTFPKDDMDTKPWFRGIAQLYRGHRLRAPLVVGLVALRGRAPPDNWRWCGGAKGVRGHPRDPGNPIRCVAICVGGSHALVYQPDCYHSKSKYTGGALPFREGSKMARLRAFLDNRRVTVACVGAREAAEKLAEEWEVDVARPAELTDLFARAFGKVAGVDAVKPPKEPEPDKRWMTRSALLRAEAKAEAAEEEGYNSYSKHGRRPVAEVVKGLSLERMAFVALGPEMRLAPWPAKAADAEWGSYDLEKSEWKYAARDAYLCFEIAARCLQKLGAPIGN